MFVLAAAVFRFSARAIAEPDIWWHMRNAAYLFQHHSIPRVDMYSFGAAGSPSLNHEWLSEIPFFLGFKAMGLQGLLAIYFTVLVLIYAGVYYRSLRAGANCKNATVTTLLAIFMGAVSTGPRMLLFGWLCMVALLLVLDYFQRTGKGLWLLPPLFVLWINLHGSWLFGLVVVAIIIASGLVEGEWGLVEARRWSPTQLKKLLLAFAASLAAPFANPLGYKLVLDPFEMLGRQQGITKYIEEWQPVDFNGKNGEVAMILIIALLAAALFSRRKWKLDEVLLTAFALWAALSHVRFLFFAGLIVAPILAPRLTLFPPYERELDKPWLNAGVIAAIVAWAIFTFPSAARLQQLVDEEYPTAALEFIQQQHINGRIFNPLLWGGYMEWYAPQLKPFVDTRDDIFIYNGALEDYLRATSMKRSFEILDKYNIDYAFIQPASSLAYLLGHSPAWHPIYTDKVAVLFERTGRSAAAANPARN